MAHIHMVHNKPQAPKPYSPKPSVDASGAQHLRRVLSSAAEDDLLGFASYALKSKLLKWGYMGDSIGDRYRAL